MPRTTPALVQTIVKTRAGVDLTAFILPASELVTERCAPVLQSDGVTPFHSATRLELIERYLAAHFYQIYRPRAVQAGAGKVQATYQSKVDLYLTNTHYGQQAMLLDTTGSLAALNAAMEAAAGTLPESGGAVAAVFASKPNEDSW